MVWCSPYTARNELKHDKTNKMSMLPAKTQVSLGIRPVSSESLLCAWRNLLSLATHWVHSEDSDQTGQMPRLIWVFAGCTAISLVLSSRGSNVFFLCVFKYMLLELIKCKKSTCLVIFWMVYHVGVNLCLQGIEQLKKEQTTWARRSYWLSIKSVFGHPFSWRWFSPFSKPNFVYFENRLYAV